MRAKVLVLFCTGTLFLFLFCLLLSEQIQRRFAFRDSGRYNLADVFGKAKRKVTKPLRSPVALLYYLLPITKILKSYSHDKLAKDALVGITMATLMIPQVGHESATRCQCTTVRHEARVRKSSVTYVCSTV